MKNVVIYLFVIISLLNFGGGSFALEYQPNNFHGSLLEDLTTPLLVQKDDIKNNVVVISNAAELRAFARTVNGGESFQGKTIRLSNDICLNDTMGWQQWGGRDKNDPKLKSWIPIGREGAPFEGTFDGAGHCISGLFVKAETEGFYYGLFGYLKHASVINLHLRYSYISAYNFVGGIAGYITLYSFVSGCSAEDCIIKGARNYVGGIIGFSEGLNRIIGCHNTAWVYGHRCIGGIVGYYGGGSLYNSYNRGKITGRYEHVGGIVGEYSEPYYKDSERLGLNSLPNDTLANCYNTGEISGRDVVGGIAGHVFLYSDEVAGTDVLFSNNYNAGKLKTVYPIVTDGIVGAYTYFPNPKELVTPTIKRIEHSSKPCYWSEECCKIVELNKPRFEATLIRGEAWNTLSYGVSAIPRMFRYFPEKSMKEQTFVDLLNRFADNNGPFLSWSIDVRNLNNGFPIFQ